MEEQALKVGAVDIGTNSMRLLITDGLSEYERHARVTGLGRGVDSSGRLSDAAMNRTLGALTVYGGMMDRERVALRRAIATSASRDASNRDEFFDLAESALGVRPEVISGDDEARLAFDGATSHIADATDTIVSDIGGGSTEFVTQETSASVNVGSVRLTERVLIDRPATPEQLEAGRQVVSDRFEMVDIAARGRLIGVAGTWTSLAAMTLNLPEYDRAMVHDSVIEGEDLERLVEWLATLTIEQTEQIPSLDPDRAPVILAGAVIAAGVVAAVGVDRVNISERDGLDAVAAGLLDLL